jgi:subtilisin family serine protease
MAKFAVSLLFALAVIGGAVADTPKVNPFLQEKVTRGHIVNVVVSLRESTQSVLDSINSRANTFADRTSRINALVSALKSHAGATQAPVMAALTEFPTLVVKTYWISNQIYVSGANAAVVAKLAALKEVAEIHEEKIIKIEEPINYSEQEGEIAPTAEWGVNSINAPEAWELGFTGEGALIATIDTGARVSHVTLQDNYVGGGYGWFDPYQGTSAPNDQNGHGTHTTANIAGKNGVGVAPGAKWMACKGCSTSSCTENALLACGQWVTCPTWSDGSNEDCSKAPTLSSNSWGGGQGDQFYNPVINAWHVAGITPVFAIGNGGPLCTTANSPGDQNVISVGASTAANGLALFSSKGPSIDGNIKPEISAPGENIRSASHTGDNAYATNSGTSMACPHVAGVVALVKAAHPGITYIELMSLLTGTATKNLTPTARNCGGIDTSTFPNNSYGYGKVNARNAVVETLRKLKQARA